MVETVLIAAVAFLAGAGLAAILLRTSREAMRATAEDLRVRFAESQASLRAEKEKTLWTEDAREQFKNAFKVLASDELESKSAQLKNTAKDELNVVVGP